MKGSSSFKAEPFIRSQKRSLQATTGCSFNTNASDTLRIVILNHPRCDYPFSVDWLGNGELLTWIMVSEISPGASNKAQGYNRVHNRIIQLPHNRQALSDGYTLGNPSAFCLFAEGLARLVQDGILENIFWE